MHDAVIEREMAVPA